MFFRENENVGDPHPNIRSNQVEFNVFIQLLMPLSTYFGRVFTARCYAKIVSNLHVIKTLYMLTTRENRLSLAWQSTTAHVLLRRVNYNLALYMTLKDVTLYPCICKSFMLV